MVVMPKVETSHRSFDIPETSADLLDQQRFAKETDGKEFHQVNVVPLLMGMQGMAFAPLDQRRPSWEPEESLAQVVALERIVNLQGVQRLS
jgi:hypothetical protein